MTLQAGLRVSASGREDLPFRSSLSSHTSLSGSAALSLEDLAASRGWPEVERWRTLQAGVRVAGSGREDFRFRSSAASLGCWPLVAVLSLEDVSASRGGPEVERWRTLQAGVRVAG